MQQVIIVLADTTEQAEKNEEFIELVQAADMEIKETFTQKSEKHYAENLYRYR